MSAAALISARWHVRRGEFSNYKGPLKAAILDWSGTTADAHVLAPAVVFCEVFAKHGVPISMQEARAPMGLRKDLHIGKILEMSAVRDRWTKAKGRAPVAADVDALFADFVPMQVAVLGRYSALIPGTVEAVAELRGKLGLKIGITTGFTRVMVAKLLEDAAKQGFVPDTCVAGDDVPNNLGFRPAPFMVMQNLMQLGGVFPVHAVVKVDDTLGGIGEGLNAGCWTVAVSDFSNYTDIDSLEQWERMSPAERRARQDRARKILVEQSGAHYVVDSITDLPAVCRHINERLAQGERP
jgi:phosphonoacetaldehyde hydrolase